MLTLAIITLLPLAISGQRRLSAMRKNIQNYTSEVSVEATLQQMQQMLVHSARSLMFTYTAQGEVEAIAFSIQARTAVLPIQLPARVGQVAHVL